MKKMTAYQSILNALSTHKSELASLYKQALLDTRMTNKDKLHPSQLEQIHQSEADAFFTYVEQMDPTLPQQRGQAHYEIGLSEESVMQMGRTVRHFCLTTVSPEQQMTVLDIADDYHAEVMKGYVQTVEKYAAQVQAVSKIGQTAASTLDLWELLTVSVEQIRSQFNFYYVGVFLIDKYKQWAVFHAGTGMAGQELIHRGYRLSLEDESSIGKCIRNGELLTLVDHTDSRTPQENELLPDTRSEVIFPLRSYDHVLGAITLQSKALNSFSEQELSILAVLADQLSSAIDSARLFTQVEESLLEERTTHRRYIRDAWTNSDEMQTAYVYEQSADAFLSMDTAAGADDKDRPTWLFDDWQAHADEDVLAVPISVRGEIIGTVELVDIFGNKKWDDEALRLAMDVVEQTAVSLENARLLTATEDALRQTEERSEELTLLNEISKMVSTHLELSTLFESVGPRLQEAFSAKSVFFALYNASSNMIDFPYFYNQDIGIQHVPSRLADEKGGFTAEIIRTKRPFIFNSTEAEFIERGGLIEGLRRIPDTFIGVPMLIADKVIGVIGVNSYRVDHLYDEEDQRLLSTLSGAISIAVQNARQFEAARKRAERERLINEINQKIRGAQTIEGAMQTAVAELGRALNVKKAVVALS